MFQFDRCVREFASLAHPPNFAKAPLKISTKFCKVYNKKCDFIFFLWILQNCVKLIHLSNWNLACSLEIDEHVARVRYFALNYDPKSLWGRVEAKI